MSKFGALTKLLKMMQAADPEIKDPRRTSQIEEAGYMLAGGEEVSAENRAALLSYLRNEGADPAWADAPPGFVPSPRNGVPQLRVPNETDRLFRGGDPSLRLQEPVFTTTDPYSAMFYSTESRAQDFGGLGEYAVEGSNPARLRDLYRVMLEDPALLKHSVKNAEYNMWDHLYAPEVRQAVQDRGYNSALGLDPIERSNLEVFIALNKGLLKPKTRRIVGFEGAPIADHFAEVTPLGEDFVQFGKTRPWTKRKKGGLVQMCGCGK